jgi:hypothetical protein
MEIGILCTQISQLIIEFKDQVIDLIYTRRSGERGAMIAGAIYSPWKNTGYKYLTVRTSVKNVSQKNFVLSQNIRSSCVREVKVICTNMEYTSLCSVANKPTKVGKQCRNFST